MKYLLIPLSLCLSTQAFAGAYGLYCKNADKSFILSGGEVKMTQTNGVKVEGIYFSEESNDLMGWDIQDFLQDSRDKVFIERPRLIDNRHNELKVISRRTYKDECGNEGEEVKFKASFRALDMQGNEIKAPTVLKCTSNAIPGHCI